MTVIHVAIWENVHTNFSSIKITTFLGRLATRKTAQNTDNESEKQDMAKDPVNNSEKGKTMSL
jgi:hypothetical protein